MMEDIFDRTWIRLDNDTLCQARSISERQCYFVARWIQSGGVLSLCDKHAMEAVTDGGV